MEHLVRIVLGVLLFAGNLQARPPPCTLKTDLGIQLLRNQVSCRENATFSVLDDFRVQCLPTALIHIEEGLEEAYNKCHENYRISQAMDVMEQLNLRHVPMNTSECHATTRQSFGGLVNNIEAWVELYCSDAAS